MEIKSFRGKTAMLSTEIMEKNEQLGNVRPRQGTVPRPIIAHRTVPCDISRFNIVARITQTPFSYNKEVHVNEDIQDLTYQNSIDHAIRYNHGVAYRRYDRIQ